MHQGASSHDPNALLNPTEQARQAEWGQLRQGLQGLGEYSLLYLRSPMDYAPAVE